MAVVFRQNSLGGWRLSWRVQREALRLIGRLTTGIRGRMAICEAVAYLVLCVQANAAAAADDR